MKIEFLRTGERRYAVVVHRPHGPPLHMSPAPGYDAAMPHDMLHYVVESELGLRSGIFGQLAEGGTAGTFQETASEGGEARDAARRRRRLAKRGGRLLREGRGDAASSERAVDACFRAWLARRAGRRSELASDVVSPEALERVLARMDELSAQWSALAIGESVAVDWPARSGKKTR